MTPACKSPVISSPPALFPAKRTSKVSLAKRRLPLRIERPSHRRSPSQKRAPPKPAPRSKSWAPKRPKSLPHQRPRPSPLPPRSLPNRSRLLPPLHPRPSAPLRRLPLIRLPPPLRELAPTSSVPDHLARSRSPHPPRLSQVHRPPWPRSCLPSSPLQRKSPHLSPSRPSSRPSNQQANRQPPNPASLTWDPALEKPRPNFLPCPPRPRGIGPAP